MKGGFNITSNLTNKFFYILTALVILAAIGTSVYAATTGTVAPINPGHNSTQVFIPVGNSYITLQNAIDYGYLLGTNTSTVQTTFLPVSLPYHLASQVLMNITSGGKNYTMTLQEAINHNVFMSGVTQSYTTAVPAGGHYASQVNINTTNGVMTLQNAINTNVNLLSSFSFCTGQPIGTSCGTNKACDGNGNCKSLVWLQGATNGCVPTACYNIAGGVSCYNYLGYSCSSYGLTQGCIWGGTCAGQYTCRTGSVVCGFS